MGNSDNVNLGILDKMDITISFGRDVWIFMGVLGFLAIAGTSSYIPRRKKSNNLGEAQHELFKAGRKFEKLEPLDIATSDDPVIQCLERKGWNPKRILTLQASIAEKMTPDLFTKEVKKLSGGEIQLQENIEDCLERMRKQRNIKPGTRSGQMDLFGSCRIIRPKKKR